MRIDIESKNLHDQFHQKNFDVQPLRRGKLQLNETPWIPSHIYIIKPSHVAVLSEEVIANHNFPRGTLNQHVKLFSGSRRKSQSNWTQALDLDTADRAGNTGGREVFRWRQEAGEERCNRVSYFHPP
ncbi:hypothetical protein SLEP1_g30258 [Rubroshorea leprosula]|uniref:Uncharacterized protein n=1 Tax=Rubroshorea leprosula TaxID=152421 RepID=A0AAV5K686_9ROSI|nr:hypothetical protein SLEP1_g30258 [Rubroshorea leprosula]